MNAMQGRPIDPDDLFSGRSDEEDDEDDEQYTTRKSRPKTS
ncbi:MAG: hypothetical protein V3U13_04930 [Gemmatimonadota bacterium]|jgi:hypothetical protein